MNKVILHKNFLQPRGITKDYALSDDSTFKPILDSILEINEIFTRLLDIAGKAKSINKSIINTLKQTSLKIEEIVKLCEYITSSIGENRKYLIPIITKMHDNIVSDIEELSKVLLTV